MSLWLLTFACDLVELVTWYCLNWSHDTVEFSHMISSMSLYYIHMSLWFTWVSGPITFKCDWVEIVTWSCGYMYSSDLLKLKLLTLNYFVIYLQSAWTSNIYITPKSTVTNNQKGWEELAQVVPPVFFQSSTYEPLPSFYWAGRHVSPLGMHRTWCWWY